MSEVVEEEFVTFHTDRGHSSNFSVVQKFLGLRPGNKMVDPYYLRKGIGNKPYFWDNDKKKWLLVRDGDKFYIDEQDIPRMERS